MKDDWNTKAKMACQDRAARLQGLVIRPTDELHTAVIYIIIICFILHYFVDMTDLRCQKQWWLEISMWEKHA